MSTNEINDDELRTMLARYVVSGVVGRVKLEEFASRATDRIRELVGVRFERCEFVETDLSWVRYVNCRFVDCVFRKARIRGTRQENTAFVNCTLSRVSFEESHLSYEGSSWTGSTFDRCILKRAYAEGEHTDCVFRNCDFKKFSAQKARFENCAFVGKMIEADFDFRRIPGHSMNASGRNLNFSEVEFVDSGVTGCVIERDHIQLPKGAFVVFGVVDALEKLLGYYRARPDADGSALLIQQTERLLLETKAGLEPNPDLIWPGGGFWPPAKPNDAMTELGIRFIESVH